MVDAAGRPLLSTRLRADDRVAGCTRLHAGADPAAAAGEALVDLAGLRLATTDQALAGPLVRAGAGLHLVAIDMTHDLADLPAPSPLPHGWTLAPDRWDADLAGAVVEAYGPDRVDGPWGEQDTAQVAVLGALACAPRVSLIRTAAAPDRCSGVSSGWSGVRRSAVVSRTGSSSTCSPEKSVGQLPDSLRPREQQRRFPARRAAAPL